MKLARIAALAGILSLALAMAGCGTQETIYIRMSAPQVSNDLTYTDPELGLAFDFTPTYTTMHFTVTNKSADMIRLIWDNTAFVDFNGQPSRVIHYGIKYIDKEKSMVPSMIPPGLTLKEGMTPANRVWWSGSAWMELPLVSNTYKAIGNTMGFIMCFEKNGQQKYIDFKFEIVGIQSSLNNGTPSRSPSAAFSRGKEAGTIVIPVFELPNSKDRDGVFEAE